MKGPLEDGHDASFTEFDQTQRTDTELLERIGRLTELSRPIRLLQTK